MPTGRRSAGGSTWTCSPGFLSQPRLAWQDQQLRCRLQFGGSLDPELYRAWREWISTYGTGDAQRQRSDVYGILLLVRAFYLDLQSWAVAEPERWARWVAPCPILPSATRGYASHRHRQVDRMADRTRVRQPMLPLLVEHVQAGYEHARDLLALARAAAPDATVEFRGLRYQRVWTKNDQALRRRRAHQRPSPRPGHRRAEEPRCRRGAGVLGVGAVVQVLRLTGSGTRSCSS